MKTGFIHVYCGNGKGKTTAAFGLILRAAGYGYRCIVCQFLKDNDTNERKLLKKAPNITLIEGREEVKFSFQMSEQERNESKEFYKKMFREVTEKAKKEGCEVLFLDEILYAVSIGMIEEESVIDFLKGKPKNMEVILTGNPSTERINEIADYVSEIRMIKHPYLRGIKAREGIEY